MKITRARRETIFPATPTSPCVLALSNVDRVMPRIHSTMLYHFLAKPGVQFLSGADLKASLSQALSLHYPLAGRVREREDKGLEIDCNDAGAEFVEAEAEGPLSDLGGFQPNQEFQHLMPSVNQQLPLADIPLLLVQVTSFQCGGVTLGVDFHHSVGDGLAMSSFLVAWSEIALGKEVSMLPHHDRSLLKSRHPPCSKFAHQEYLLQCPISTYPSSFPSTSKLLEFDCSQISALKQRASEHGSFTAFESLTGHLWQCVNRARRLHPSKETEVVMAVDGRKRLVPPVPPEYSGNVVFTGKAQAPADELVASPLSYAADRVHQAIVRMTDEYMRSAIDFVAEQDSFVSLLPTFTGSNLVVTSWTRFPLYDVDFGMGKPDFVGTLLAEVDGLVVLLPSHRGNGAVNVMITLLVDHFASFVEDPSLVPQA